MDRLYRLDKPGLSSPAENIVATKSDLEEDAVNATESSEDKPGLEENRKSAQGGSQGPPWELYLSELIGTAALVAIGVSFVILDFGRGSVMAAILPGAGERRALTGFLFGSTGALIAFSSVGKVSGAHINPAVTLAFWLTGKMRAGHAAGYVLAQTAGGALGALPLLSWEQIGESVNFGATLPGPGYGTGIALLGEIAATFLLVALLFVFISSRRLRSFTPLIFPFLYAVMVYLEAPLSGTSTNPARSLGPALVSGYWRGWWVYWAGPAAGASLAVVLHKLRIVTRVEIEVAKLYHFESDPRGIFRYRR